ncbi:UPF0182 family protein [Nocardioides bigeumensis]|uniref:UPF0182 protein GCM10009843_22510 n=1 Tax=Nocardioides bigeumensis TaxID=433657 RepID=A0ABN2YC05_9ACTN
MSDLFDDDPRDEQPRAQRSSRSRALVITAVVLLAGFIGLTAFATFWTERLWFTSLGYQSVFSTLLWTRIGLFLVFAAVMALAVGANMMVAYRTRPLFRPSTPEQTGLDRYRDVVLPVRTWLMAGTSILIGVFAGASASSQWRSFLLWRNGTDFGVKDAYFGMDVGFFVFDLPWLHYVIDFVMAVCVVALLASAAVHYLFGGIRLQVPQDRLSPSAMAQFSVLLGFFVLAKGADYWLDRYDLLDESGSLITGMNYADENAVLPARNILTGIAIICALLFFLNVWRRTWLLSGMGLAMLVVSSILIGMIWPGIVQQFTVNPSEPDKEAPYIKANIDATREAYDIAGVETLDYTRQAALPSDDDSPSEAEAIRTRLQTQMDTQLSTTPLIDPQLVGQAFEQEQQVRAYYSVADVLDVDRYEIDGKQRALVLGVRELNQQGIDEGSRNWANLHTVYTHGNGMIAAFGNQRPANDLTQDSRGDVQWAEGREPSERTLTNLTPTGYQTKVYYGEQSPSYSIVGKAPGGRDVELDLPPGTIAEGEESTTTYDGEGGVAVGSLFRKLLYAIKFGEPNLVLSERVNANSKILYDRNPGDMVKKVAPWLTVDSDPYPAVVDGRVLWILDGYTTTDRYPQSQKASFDAMTEDSLATNTGFQTLPTDEINYMRNAVKATVDAYDGTVRIYAWDEADPLLKAWRAAFPGVVLDREEIPTALMSHLRYPEDLFKVQRYQLARYHVTDEKDFYEDNSRWEVPADPNLTSRKQPPYRIFVAPTSVQENEDGTEETVTATDPADQVYSLTSVFVPNGKQSLAGYISVNSDATDAENYGKLQILQMSTEDNDGPRLAANAISSDEDVRDAVLSFTQGDVRTAYGNLLTLPVADGLLYVQPLYASRDQTSPRTLQFVLVSYGDRVGIGRTLDDAVEDVLGASGDTPPTTPTDPGDGEPTDPGDPQVTGELPAEVQRALDQAAAAYAEADAAQRDGDTALWAEKLEEARRHVDRALRLLEQSEQGGGGAGGGTQEPEATASPSPTESPSGS